jgi:drug/metabolite transporter (DMT)-like permease
MDFIQLLLYSTLFSVVILGAIVLATGKWKVLLTYGRKEYSQSFWFGLLNPFLYYLVLLKAYDLLPAQEAQTLNYTWAITLAILSVPLLGQRMSKKEMLGIMVSYTGVVIIATRGDFTGLHFSNLRGVGLALGSTIIWSLYWIFNTKDTRDPVLGLFLNFLLGLPFVLAVCIVFSTVRLDSWLGLLGAAYVGCFEMGITFVLWLTALKLTRNAARIGNLVFLSPFLSLVFIHFLVGETILYSTFLGLIVIILGLLIQQIGSGRFRT